MNIEKTFGTKITEFPQWEMMKLRSDKRVYTATALDNTVNWQYIIQDTLMMVSNCPMLI